MHALLLLVIALLIGPFQTGCSNGTNGATTHLTHPNGLSISVAAGINHTETAHGFQLRPPLSGSMRGISETNIQRTSRRPEGDWPEQRKVNGQTMYYRLEEFHGGSGGEEYELTAWKQIGGSYVLLNVHRQQEGTGRPEFESDWEILAHARVAD